MPAGLAAIAGLVLGDLLFLGMAILGLNALAAVVTLVLFLVLSVYAFLAARAGRLLASPRAHTWLNRVTGGLLVSAGVAVATR